MTSVIMDGRKASAEAKDEIRIRVDDLKKSGILPALAVVMVGGDPASRVYAGQKKKNCEKVGINFFFHELPEDSTEDEVLEVVKNLNEDKSVHGILIEMPLPGHLSNERIQASIYPEKDIDGSNPANLGRLVSGLHALMPCTPQGVMYLMEKYDISFEGKNAVVVGRSNIVGKPVAHLLLEKNATVTICHSRTKDMTSILKLADIVVVGVGKPELIKRDMIKPGAVVVDVGINSTDHGLVGDVDFEAVKEVAGYISPVPGGVGPLTIAMLLSNVVEAAIRSVKR